MTLAIRQPNRRPAALRAGAVLAACAAIGATVTGCDAGPTQIGSAALVGGHSISLDVVQQNISNVLADSADARALQQQKPSTFPPVARTVVKYAVWDELSTQLAAKQGIRVDQTQVDQLYNQVQSSGQGPSLSQLKNIPVKGEMLRNYAKDILIWQAVGAKAGGVSITIDAALVQDRATAQALVDKVVANPGQDKQLFQAAGQASGQVVVDQTYSPAQTPQVLFPAYGAKPGSVIAFDSPSENGDSWVVAYVKKRADTAGQSSDVQSDPQVDTLLGQELMNQFGAQVGVTLNPRFGIWEPVIGVVSPSDGESSTISSSVKP